MGQGVMQDFLKELADLMHKHKVTIGFGCGEGSDTHGIRGAHMEICSPEKTITFPFQWDINSHDVRKAIKGGKV